MAAAAATTKAALQPLFKKGGKEIFLPTARIALLNTSKSLPPNFARFYVPLEWNKLDIRDYLHNAYGVRVLSVRSHVYQPKPEQKANAYRQMYLPKAKKSMTVELERPFAWPEQPEDMSEWDPENHAAAQEYDNAQQDKLSPDAQFMAKTNAYKKNMRDQAKALLEGREQWKPTWQAFDEARTEMTRKAQMAADAKRSREQGHEQER